MPRIFRNAPATHTKERFPLRAGRCFTHTKERFALGEGALSAFKEAPRQTLPPTKSIANAQYSAQPKARQGFRVHDIPQPAPKASPLRPSQAAPAANVNNPVDGAFCPRINRNGAHAWEGTLSAVIHAYIGTLHAFSGTLYAWEGTGQGSQSHIQRGFPEFFSPHVFKYLLLIKLYIKNQIVGPTFLWTASCPHPGRPYEKSLRENQTPAGCAGKTKTRLQKKRSDLCVMRILDSDIQTQTPTRREAR